MASKSKLKLSVTWGSRQLIPPSFYSFENSWLRNTSVRELLSHVVHEADANLSCPVLGDAETITVKVVEYSDEISSSGGKRKRRKDSSDATRLLDDTTYEVMEDVPTREFHFVVVEATYSARATCC